MAENTANTVNVINPEGKLVSLPVSQVNDAIQSGGYTIPSPSEEHDLKLQSKFGEGLGNELKAGLAGAARGLSFGLSDQALTKSGAVNPETLSALKEYNPGSSFAGEVGGVLAPAILSGGASTLAEGAAGAAGKAAIGEAAGETAANVASKTALNKAAGIVGAPVSAVSKAGQAVTNAVTPLAEKATGLLVNPETSPLASKIISKGLAHGAGSAVEGAAYGLGQSISEDALGDPDALGEKLLANVGFGAFLGGGLGAAMGGGGPAISAIKDGLKDTNFASPIKKALSILGGVPEKDIGAYMENHAAVNSAPEYEEVYNHAIDHIEKVNADLDAKKISLADAKESFKELESQMKDNLRQKGFDASTVNTTAKMALKDAQVKMFNDLQERALGTADRVSSATEALRQKVVSGSSDAYKILEGSGSEVGLDDFFKKGNELIADLHSKGTLESKAYAERLQTYLDNVKTQVKDASSGIPKDVSGSQPLNKPSDFFDFEPSGKPSTPTEKPIEYVSNDALSGKRIGKGPTQNLDHVSSKHLEYAIQHDGINPDTKYEIDVDEAKRVLARRADKSGEKELAQYKKDLKNGETLTHEDNAPLKIGAANAKKLIQGLDDVSKYDFNATSFDKGMSRAYKQLRWTLDDTLKNAVPEYREAMKPLAEDTGLLKKLDKYGTQESATRRLKSIKNADIYKNEMPLLRKLEESVGGNFTKDIEPYANPKIKERMMKSIPEFEAAEKAAHELQALRNPETIQKLNEELALHPKYLKAQQAKSEFDAAKAAADSLGVTPNNLQGKLNSVMNGRSIQGEKILSSIPEMNGKKIPELLELIRLNNLFNKGAMNGSRNVNMFTGLLGAAGGALGGHIMAGAGIGAGVGGIVDKYGPAITKKLLDMHVEGLSKVERATNQVQKGIVSSSKSIFENTKKATLSASTMPKVASTDKIKEQVADLSNSPAKMIDHLDNSTQWIYNYAPKTAGSIQLTATKATNFLQMKMPKAPPNKPLSPKYIMNPAEMSKFNRYYQTVEDPTHVLDHIKTGSLLPEHMETLQNVYPKLLQSMQASVTESLTNFIQKNDVNELPYFKKMSLSLFLGQDLENSLSPEAIQANQLVMSSANGSQKDDQAVKPSQTGMQNLSFNTRALTPMQGLMQGGQA